MFISIIRSLYYEIKPFFLMFLFDPPLKTSEKHQRFSFVFRRDPNIKLTKNELNKFKNLIWCLMLTLNTVLTARKNFLKNSELTNHKKSHLIVYIVNFWELRQSFLDFSSFRERKNKRKIAILINWKQKLFWLWYHCIKSSIICISLKY